MIPGIRKVPDVRNEQGRGQLLLLQLLHPIFRQHIQLLLDKPFRLADMTLIHAGSPNR